MSSLLLDLRYGLRVLARNPGSALLIVAFLSVGLGATTVLFSLYDVSFLRRLPVRNPEQLVRMVKYVPKIGAYSEFPYSYYQALYDHATTLAATFGETIYQTHFALTDPEPAEELTVQGVTPEFFEALGVRALYGRVLMADDAIEQPGMPP